MAVAATTPQAKRELIEAGFLPGVSVAKLALAHGINANLLRTWMTKHQRQLLAGDSPQRSAAVRSPFIPVVPVSAHRSPITPPELAAPAPQRRSAGMVGIASRSAGACSSPAVRPAMFRLDSRLKVFLHREAVDGRKSINGLALLVEQGLGLAPFAQAAYVFSNRRRDRIKILLWDRNGFWAAHQAAGGRSLQMAQGIRPHRADRRAIALVTRWHQPVGHAAAPHPKLSARGVNDFGSV
jgi:transposase-like protein/transposase